MNNSLSNTTSRIQREIELLYSEPIFDVELSSRCNINCIMCPRTKLQRKFDLMPLDLIKILINWLPPNAKVMICGLGEPLLNRDIFFFISSLHKRNIELGLTTNGMLLAEEVTDTLINSGINLIQVSFNGSNEKTYKSIMQNSSFSVVVKNLQYLAKVKKPNLTVKLAITVQEKNQDDIENIKQLADNLGFDTFLRNRHSRADAFSGAVQKAVNLSGCGIFPKVNFIATNGDILSCCQDLAGEFVLGNIASHSFSDILQEKKYILNNNAWFPICKFCDDEYRYLLLADDII